jgi:hypothetical protein
LDYKKKQRTKTRTLVFRRDLAQSEEKPEKNGDEDKFDEVCVESFGHRCCCYSYYSRESEIFLLTKFCIFNSFFSFFLFFSWTVDLLIFYRSNASLAGLCFFSRVVVWKAAKRFDF